MSAADIEELYVAHARRIAGYLMRATRDAEVAADLYGRDLRGGAARRAIATAPTWGRRTTLALRDRRATS